MNILVIGGSGLIGIPLVELLLKEGHEVTYFSRGNLTPTFSKSVNHIKGDRHSKDFPNLFTNLKFDVVIDNLVFNPENAQSAIDAFNHMNIKHYLFTSSAVVYENLEAVNIEESTPIGVGASLKGKHGERIENYCKRKVDAENVFWNASKHRTINFPFTILRPTVIEGKEDLTNRPPYWLKRILDGNEILIIQYDKLTYYQHVYSEDVAKAYLLALNNKMAFNQAYNIAGAEILEQSEYIHQLATELNTSPKVVKVPCDFIENSEENFKIEYPPLLNNIQLRISIKKAEQELNFKPTTRAIWLPSVTQWYLQFKLDSAPFYDKRSHETQMAQSYLKTKENNSQETIIKTFKSLAVGFESIPEKSEKCEEKFEKTSEDAKIIEGKKLDETFELPNNLSPTYQT